MSHNRIIIAGTLGTQEVWSTQVNFTDGDGEAVITDDGLMRTWALDAFAFLDADLAILLNALGQNAAITTVTVQYINDDGTLNSQALPATGFITGLGTMTKTFQTAIVISSLTGLAGASRRGRNYWPGLGAGISSTGRMSTPTAPLDVVQEFRDMVQGLADAAPGSITPVPVVYSPKLGLTTVVVGYSCGDVLDTQRRRRDSLVEAYSSTAYP